MYKRPLLLSYSYLKIVQVEVSKYLDKEFLGIANKVWI